VLSWPNNISSTPVEVAERNSPPDIADLDVGLPGFDGHEIARRLRAAATAPSIASVHCKRASTRT
jgi:DNA-binding response OmpR family regulator